jgi:sugar phosphate isomerase/epimerase
MKIGLVTDSLSSEPFEDMLDQAASVGVEQVEFATGGWSEAPHIDIDLLLADAHARDRFVGAVAVRGMTISALNANGNQLHPVIGKQVDQVVRKTVELASLMGIPTVVLMSGLPGGGPQDLNPNWVTTSWPPETQTILNYQWNEVALPYWRDLAALGRSKGVQFAVEMHGTQLVYNADTLLRLREAVGEVVGANLDPSHPMWMGADPRMVARALSGAIHNVHAKDSRFQPHVVAVNGVLGTQPPEEAANRPWNYVTLGLGNPGGSQFWGQFLSDLRAAGYDGVLSIEHEDVQMDALEGVAQTVALLRSVILTKPPSWRPAAI